MVATQYFIGEGNKQLAIFQRETTTNTPLEAGLIGLTCFDTITIMVFIKPNSVVELIIN